MINDSVKRLTIPLKAFQNIDTVEWAMTVFFKLGRRKNLNDLF